MIKLFGDEFIEFYCRQDLFGVIPEPKLATKCIPDWFKKMPPHKGMPDEPGGFAGMSVKKCLPVLDAMNLGYVLPMQGDVHIKTNYDLSVIRAHERDGSHAIADKHPYVQIGSEAWPGFKQDPVKFLNYWCIKTKPGWSCYFTAPINHFGMPYTPISGVVDTDRYPKEVNFPVIWNVPNFDDTIKAGTPMVQVIPFKRTKYPKVKAREMTDKESIKLGKIQKAQHSRVGVYTQELREPR